MSPLAIAALLAAPKLPGLSNPCTATPFSHTLIAVTRSGTHCPLGLLECKGSSTQKQGSTQWLQTCGVHAQLTHPRTACRDGGAIGHGASMHAQLPALHPIHGVLLPGGVAGGHVDGRHGCGRVLLQLPRHHGRHAMPKRACRPARRALPLAHVTARPGQGWNEGHALHRTPCFSPETINPQSQMQARVTSAFSSYRRDMCRPCHQDISWRLASYMTGFYGLQRPCIRHISIATTCSTAVGQYLLSALF